MGQGPVEAYDPGKEAGDISFVAEYVDGLDGLGTMGGGSYTKSIWS
jgi:glutamate carboxypeptidase